MVIDVESQRQSYLRSKMKSPYLHKHWIKLSKAFLKAHPLCQMCLAKRIINKSQHADHINGFTTRAEFFNWSNLQALCIPCHNMKTHTAGGPDWTRRQTAKLGEKTWDY